MRTHRGRTCFALALTIALALASATSADAVIRGRTGNIAVDVVKSDRGGGFSSEIVVFDQSGRRVTGFGRCLADPATPGAPETPGPCPGHPAYSPDGLKIAYDFGLEDRPRRIVIRNENGSSPNTLPLLTESDSEPVFSPGGQLAFTGLRDGRRNIYIVDRDGSDLRQLTLAGGRTAAWSLRNRIAFVRRGRLYTINPDGSGRRRLRRGDKPDFSPEGERIVYQRTFRAGTDRAKTSLFVLRSARRYRRLTRGRGFAPSWSPGGGLIAYERPIGGFEDFPTDLATLRPNRTGLRILLQGEASSFNTSYVDPAWQSLPDSIGN